MIEITICTGTLCHIMGGAELFDIEEQLNRIANKPVKLKASTCLGSCEGENRSKPPCIMIQDTLMPEATIEKIINHIKAKM